MTSRKRKSAHGGGGGGISAIIQSSSNLDLTEPFKIQNDFEEIRMSRINKDAITALTRFLIFSEHYMVDLNNIKLCYDFRIVQETVDGTTEPLPRPVLTTVGAGEKKTSVLTGIFATPQFGFGLSSIKKLNVTIGEAKVCQLDHYHHNVSWSTALDLNERELNELREPGFFVEDSETGPDGTKFVSVQDKTNTGLTERSILLNRKDQQWTRVKSLLMVEGLGNMGRKLLPTRVPVQIELEMGEPELTLTCNQDNRKLVIEVKDMHLLVRLFRLNLSATAGLEASLARNGDSYHWMEKSCNYEIIATGKREHMMTIERESMPKRLLMFFIDSEQFRGSYKRNTLFYSHFNLSKAQLYYGTDVFPVESYERLESANCEWSEFWEAFLRVNRLEEKIRSGPYPVITQSKFLKGGRFCVSFDMTIGGSDGSQPRSEDAHLKLTFGVPLAEEVVVFCLKFFDRHMQINGSREVELL